MTAFALGDTIEEADGTQTDCPTVFLAGPEEARQAMELAGVEYEGAVSLRDVGFCKVEVQQECMVGSLCVPRLLDVLGKRYRVLLFISQRDLVIVDDGDLSLRMVRHILRRRGAQSLSREQFLCRFLLQFMNRDLELLSQYEQRIMALEEQVMSGKRQGFQSEIMPIRKELLTLRSYYDELMDMGRELEENENGFFAKKQVKYFGTVADRAERLMGRTACLLEYAQQVREACQSQVDAEQNRNMQFLTVISTIFFPLTLITGWYGMNFQDMPELENGYPGVILLSITVVVACVVIFKRKKML